jgi:type VI secretion system secreted protein Hcp
MAVSMHMQIDTIPGMSQISGFEDQIQVESFSWGASQTTNFKSATGGTAGIVDMGDLHFTHLYDKASPKLMQACATGQHITGAVFTCQKAGGDATVPFLTITLTNVIVSSVAPSGSNMADTPVESVSLAFAQYKVEYQEQDNTGAKKGGPIAASFNVQQNKAC